MQLRLEFNIHFLLIQVQPGGNSDGLKGGDIDPRVVFHHGVPSGSNTLAYDSIQKILAVSTK